MITNLVLVEPGDTLSQIALTVMGDPKFADAIAAVNGIPNPDLIFPGMLLRMPFKGNAAQPGDPQPARPVRVAVGKIEKVEFGPDIDADGELSLRVDLSFEGLSASDRVFDLDRVQLAMIQAKVRDVSQLRGKPVQVTGRDNTLVGWRILTEVL